ncbi:4a-hydroxytetrahydrobiopterin dehydratase [Pelagibacterium halotolerans]|uniref:Putative pterin-4-alpha-carbinolamine dehydratase n=1 Tax=Pelagibacterium halotolerans (strain DSM 22347 / JCM 15775 / CGMCC 1.7692 / B2) TaxID=1082931 RepID=G4R6V7_PELHB|nr:4a-hydroxytetrahydrobiopterin dehydratase [Pelagibacterium halotolerans]AEQ53230.1 Pterin-4-alpha-carbinolamine dehydratase [Pelagibacterium halotolerans B2]QJR17139.1 4a-hydroxytetrahydrobiopterin dehydratase [Pelagibacterium halotolerans]SEA96308.1 4a-hydroxytetrahydrobiopterin dehydratase [Pelagibacterium halotolerans]
MTDQGSQTGFDVKTAMAGLEGWQVSESGAMEKSFKFKDFSRAFAFMTRVALLAERAGHHPDWSNSYNRVDIALKTHDKDALTQKDIDLATAIDAL